LFAYPNAGRDDETKNGVEGEDDPLEEVEELASDQDEDVQSASEDETLTSNSYVLLLQSLNARKETSEPPRKRRKFIESDHSGGLVKSKHAKLEHIGQEQKAQAEEHPVELGEEVEADEVDDQAAGADSDDEEMLLRDPFERHYTAISGEELKSAVTQAEWETSSSMLDSDIRRTVICRIGTPEKIAELRSAKDAYLKRRLIDGGVKVVSSLSAEERNVAGSMFNYADVLNGCRNLKNVACLRDLSCLHALNHVFKTRDRVLKNNAKLAVQSAEVPDLRDQGFTRPKVLIIVPTKQACVRVVDSITKISVPDQQENKARFLETYSREDEDEWQDKPDDFRELFGGNHEEDFRIGLKFTRKTIKFFSGFYNSDIIIGSPLGLMRTITTGGGGKDKKKAHDADFLSSIEIVMVDHANALQMQNWQHVDYVFSQLNMLPKDSHGCDFSRVRHWYLDGQAKYLRQTIIFADYLTPEINSLASTHLHNIDGRVKYLPTYPGAMLSVSSLVLPIPFTTPIPQTFLRIPSPNPLSDSDARFKFFTTTILAPLVRDSRHQRGILLFVPTYADFARLRNYLSTSSDTTSLSFGSLSEYTPVKEVLRARSHFLSGRHALLLYSERAHHHFRYRIKGVRKVLWYGVPENPIFWAEIISLLGLGGPRDGDVGSGRGSMKGAIRALFSRWDALKLERIVGTERVGRLINDRGGDTFEFV
jgi:U3 small nucleolar RNA-associated protein 25